MTFIDLQFGIFLLVSILLFYLCPVKQRWKVLLLVSLVFYAIAGLRYLPFIFVTSFTVYYAGCRMGKVYEALEKELAEKELDRKEKKLKKEQAKQVCKRIMLLALVGNLVILCIVKFTKFFIDPINHLLMAVGGNGTFTAADIIVPLGISYYTFSALSYLLDVYWKRVEYEKSYSRFLLYLIYFPHILQGPIEHYGRLGQRLKKELTFDYDRVCKGIQLMLYGYFKKLVIADRINPFITTAYQNHNTTAGSILLLAMFLDVVYIYADFSGCMDIGRGVSEIFGIEMDLNFNHPFSSKTVTEFWRRWHMTMGGWFREYVYTPLSTSGVVKKISKMTREKKLPAPLARSLTTIIPVTVTWVLTGLWHGTGKTYVAWGIYYSFMIFMSVCFGEMLHELMVKCKVRTQTQSYHIFQMIRTTCIFAGGRLLTRPGSLHLSWAILKRTITAFSPAALFNGAVLAQGMDRKDILVAVVCILLFGCISVLQIWLEKENKHVRDLLAEQNLPVRWCIYILAIFMVVILGVYGEGYNASAFVYMAY